MSRYLKLKLLLLNALPGLCLLLFQSGCTTAEMKGTPFYSGEYGPRRGPAEQRINAWPLLYYREPALSVLWPVFEFTDDHTAIRPLFSVYGLDQHKDKREYNFFWPLCQFDLGAKENYIFPFFWGDDYRVLFPFYWRLHEPWGPKGGTDALFPFWVIHREQTNRFSGWIGWPLVHWWEDQPTGDHGSMVLPFYWNQHQTNYSLFVSPLWMHGADHNGSAWSLLTPFYYHGSNPTHTTTVTPFWAQGHSMTNDWQTLIPLAYWDRQQHTLLSPLWAHWERKNYDLDFAPWALSWKTRSHSADRSDLWLGAGLAHATWGERSGSHHLIPFYYRDEQRGILLTPFVGWDRSAGFFYPFTPLAGVRTGEQHHGSWLFPIYSHDREEKTGDVLDTYLLAGGHSRTKSSSHSWLFPLFSYTDRGPLDTQLEPGQRYANFGKDFWCLPFCWYVNQVSIRPPFGHTVSPAASTESATNTLVRASSYKTGAFPLWSYSVRSTPAEGKQNVNASVLGLLYDYKHEVRPTLDLLRPSAGESKSQDPDHAQVNTNDYTRARICWRLWHYEKLNGDVSVDVFPALTFDRKSDGFRKTAFLWHLFRYEQSPEGKTKLDLFFIPVVRKG